MRPECPPSTVDSAASILPPGSCLVPAEESTKGHQRSSHKGMANLLQKMPQRSPQAWPGLQQRLYSWFPINASPMKTRKWFSTPVKITPLHTCFKHTCLNFYDDKAYDIKATEIILVASCPTVAAPNTCYASCQH